MTGQYKELEKTQLSRPQALESELGCCLVAIDPKQFARISQAQVCPYGTCPM